MAAEPKLLEVAVASADDAVAAAQGGADRLELSVALELGGLTPTDGLLAEVRDVCSLPIVCLLRPRAGGFCYSAAEWKTMLRDAVRLAEQGAGIVSGCLTEDRQIDVHRMRELKRAVSSCELVFHRAFDCLPDRTAALEVLEQLGVNRVLTSGGAATAEQGVTEIAALQRSAAGRIEILVGSGVRPANAAELLRRTGCRQIHGTFRRSRRDETQSIVAGDWAEVDPAMVSAVREAIDRLH